MLSVGKETSQMFWENKKKTDLNFLQNYMESREAGEGGRDQTRLVMSLFVLKLVDGYMRFLILITLLLHMFEFFHNKFF